MAGRPVHIQSAILVQKLRKRKPKPITFRAMQEMDELKGVDLKTLSRWSKYNVGKIVKKVLDV